jgi:hypothetical protein
MERQEGRFSSSGSSSSIYNVPYNDHTKPLISTETDTQEVMVPRKVRFGLGSFSSSASQDSCSSVISAGESQGLLTSQKTLKSKKDMYAEQKKKELIILMKKDNTADILFFLQPSVNFVDEKEGRTPLIMAIRNRNEVIIDVLLSRKDTDINQPDYLGNTPLHHAVFECNDSLIQNLLHNPHTNCLVKNHKGFSAHQFIDPQRSDLKALFFKRIRLDQVVDKTIQARKLRGNLKNASVLNQAIIQIKQDMVNDDKTQGGQALPETIQLPIDDEFIKKVIICRLVKYINNTPFDAEVRTNVLARSLSAKK